MPRRNGSVLPIRLISPSGNMQTTSPWSSASPALRSARSICRGPSDVLIGMAPVARRNGRSQRLSYHERSMTNRIGRSVAATRSSASTNETWFGSSSTPPSSGMFRLPTTRTR